MTPRAVPAGAHTKSVKESTGTAGEGAADAVGAPVCEGVAPVLSVAVRELVCVGVTVGAAVRVAVADDVADGVVDGVGVTLAQGTE